MLINIDRQAGLVDAGLVDNEITQAYSSAAGFLVDVVATVPPDAWEAPGLGVWSVRSLVGHAARSFTLVGTYLCQQGPATIVGPGAYAAAAGSALADPAAVAARGVAAGEALGPAPATEVARLAREAGAVIAGAGTAAVAATPVGTMPLADYLRTRVVELVVHGLDLARALHRPCPTVPTDALQVTLGQLCDNAIGAGSAVPLIEALTGRAALPEGYRAVP